MEGPLGRSGLLASFCLIFLSELGDKTFFIAALLAMKLGRWVSFVGSVGALAVMTMISVGIGAAFSRVPESLQSSLPVGEIAGVALLVFFGIKALKVCPRVLCSRCQALGLLLIGLTQQHYLRQGQSRSYSPMAVQGHAAVAHEASMALSADVITHSVARAAAHRHVGLHAQVQYACSAATLGATLWPTVLPAALTMHVPTAIFAACVRRQHRTQKAAHQAAVKMSWRMHRYAARQQY
jgi:hypothetical protein